jgi:hypothetical protein
MFHSVSVSGPTIAEARGPSRSTASARRKQATTHRPWVPHQPKGIGSRDAGSHSTHLPRNVSRSTTNTNAPADHSCGHRRRRKILGGAAVMGTPSPSEWNLYCEIEHRSCPTIQKYKRDLLVIHNRSSCRYLPAGIRRRGWSSESVLGWKVKGSPTFDPEQNRERAGKLLQRRGLFLPAQSVKQIDAARKKHSVVKWRTLLRWHRQAFHINGECRSRPGRPYARLTVLAFRLEDELDRLMK